jgi:hypothetical protein
LVRPAHFAAGQKGQGRAGTGQERQLASPHFRGGISDHFDLFTLSRTWKGG